MVASVGSTRHVSAINGSPGMVSKQRASFCCVAGRTWAKRDVVDSDLQRHKGPYPMEINKRLEFHPQKNSQSFITDQPNWHRRAIRHVKGSLECIDTCLNPDHEAKQIKKTWTLLWLKILKANLTKYIQVCYCF